MISITVDLVFIGAGIQHIEAICLQEGSCVRDLIGASGCLTRYPELEDWEGRVGIFGECVSPDTIISSGDRIEIYPRLKLDPKESRRKRVAAHIKALAREKSKPKKHRQHPRSPC